MQRPADDAPERAGAPAPSALTAPSTPPAPPAPPAPLVPPAPPCTHRIHPYIERVYRDLLGRYPRWLDEEGARTYTCGTGEHVVTLPHPRDLRAALQCSYAECGAHAQVQAQMRLNATDRGMYVVICPWCVDENFLRIIRASSVLRFST